MSLHTENGWQGRLATNGYEVIRGVYDPGETNVVGGDLEAALGSAADLAEVEGTKAAPIRSRNGVVYAARNLLDIFPPARTLWDRPVLRKALTDVLGETAGLVRGLYFDKPPEQSWSLPWHQDRTIAVENNQLPSNYFCNPTRKEGVAHVEAPPDLLRQMLTLRIHLDDVTDANGPLMVMPGSHDSLRDDTETTGDGATVVLAAAGDVLAMRPMLAHCSGKSHGDCAAHRRIIHLEFAARRELPDGFRWHRFFPITIGASGGDD